MVISSIFSAELLSLALLVFRSTEKFRRKMAELPQDVHVVSGTVLMLMAPFDSPEKVLRYTGAAVPEKKLSDSNVATEPLLRS